MKEATQKSILVPKSFPSIRKRYGNRFASSLRSKRFQSSYCAKVRAEAKKRFMFFCSCPSFLDEPREETLATQASLREKGGKRDGSWRWGGGRVF